MEHYFTDNTNLRSEMRDIIYENKGVVFSFKSDLGVFSKNKVDYGSKILVEEILKNESNQKRILDVGCGYGFIGIVLASFYESEVVMTDVNKRALHLTKINIKQNNVNGEVVLSNAYENVRGKFSLIVTNPPIRAGKETVLKILSEAKDYLEEDGILYFVIRKNQGAKSIIKELESIYKIDIMKKDKGFYIMRAKIY